MSSPVLPAGKQTAWQRWELAALGGGAVARETGGIALPTAGDIERLQRAAHAEGLAAGLAEGRARAAERLAAIEALAASVGAALRAEEARIAEDLLTLALELARRMVREALGVRRELIVPLVREALRQMPASGAPARLALHPRDAALVREGIAESHGQAGCVIVEDESIERGGCRIESAATLVDATLETRWERILASLGRSHAWIEAAPGDAA
ncbi:MAG: flagellar assembly protein FliH [Burkholderiales bacterium]|nr:flagellar assembly protein FliH [Burkholderiales bacterium]